MSAGLASLGVILYKFDSLGSRLDTRLDTLGDTMGSRLDTMGSRLDTRLDTLGNTMGSRLDPLGNRIDGLNLRVDHSVSGPAASPAPAPSVPA